MQKIQNTKIQKKSKIQKYKKIQKRFKNTKIQKIRNIEIQKYQNIEIQKLMEKHPTQNLSFSTFNHASVL